MLVNGDRFPQQCPVVGAYEASNWSGQCPMQMQCTRQQVNDVCSYSYYQPPYQQTQCPRNMYVEDMPQYLPPQPVYPPQVPSYIVAPPVIPNLPCNNTPQWNYNTMCFNVDGQPCQYTSVVDLEDFMNNEKRKEKSRVAAKCRRTKEMQIFTELTDAIPAKKEELEQLDKASVMRLAISYLRVRDVVSILPESEPEKPKPKGLEEVSSELSYMQALDGFVLVFSPQGDIVYCSENITEHIGVTQMEIMGQNVFEFSHPCDHDDIREALRSTGPARRELLLRLKCTLTSKGRNVHLKSASYKVIHITGHMLTRADLNENNNVNGKISEQAKKPTTGSLIAVGRPIPHPANIEIPLDSKTFLSKHSLDMKFTYTDESLLNTLGFQPGDLVGQSLYDYHYAVDSAALAQQFKALLSKGQCETGQYRFLAKTGGYAWVQTQATVITDKQQKPISVVCVNYVISGIECKDEVFAAHQLLHADLKPVVAPKPHLAPLCPPVLTAEVANGAIVATITPEELRPIPVTELIFAPRNKEMNKGFLMFSQNEGQTMLKEEPEDLTHLAPTAGDACIPLESSPFDMFDEFILSDNYCSLLGDDLANGSPVDTLTADLLSSPEPQENDSSCEQSSLLTELSLDTFDSPRSDDLEDGNSPFIPTSDDLPVLESAVMWGALPDNVSLARPQPTESQATSPAPALQRLLAAPTGPPPQDLITNIYLDQGLISSKSVSTWETGVKRVMKQEEEPMAKRVKRSPSPVQRQSTPKQSSSVLMNLLDIEQLSVIPPATNISQYPIHMNQKMQPITGLQVPMLNVIQVQDKLLRSNTSLNNIINNSMSPLSLNLSSPNTSTFSSPALSPAFDRTSPYLTPQSMSPIGSTKMLSPDPYLSNKMLPSPSLSVMSPGMLLDPAVVTPSDFQWADTDMLTGTHGLLNAFDDVKLD